MNKGSKIFRIICLAVCLVFCLASLPAFAEEADATQEVSAEETTGNETEETATEAVEDATDESAEDAEEEEQEVLDLYAATLRDNGIYVTPSETNIAAFTYDGLRYKVEAGTGNGIRLEGFENDPSFTSDAISDTAKYVLQATGEVTVDAAHSGYFGLSVAAGTVVYRSPVESGSIYVFSAWIKMPASGSIADSGRAFTLIGDSGTEYVVGYNEIGRDVDITEGWQQVIFTFKAPEAGLFEMNFTYRGKTNMSMDDLELYEAELFWNPLEITDIEAVDSEGNAFDYRSGFSTSGTITHTTTFYNSDEDDVFYTAYIVLYKNDIMVDYKVVEGNMALVLDEDVCELTIDIPEDDDLSQYSYMVYFVSDSDMTLFYGDVPSRTNPYVVSGN